MEIVEVILTSALVNGLFVLIIQSWIKNTFAKELETHKAQLNNANEQELATLKHKLEILAMEHNSRFSLVFNDTAKAIVEVHENIIKILDASESYTESNPIDKDKTLPLVKDRMNEFLHHYRLKKIFIPHQINVKIGNFYNFVSDTISQHEDVVRASQNPMVKADIKKMYDKFWEMEKEIPNLLFELENEFQKIFGIPLEPAANK